MLSDVALFTLETEKILCSFRRDLALFMLQLHEEAAQIVSASDAEMRRMLESYADTSQIPT